MTKRLRRTDAFQIKADFGKGKLWGISSSPLQFAVFAKKLLLLDIWVILPNLLPDRVAEEKRQGRCRQTSLPPKSLGDKSLVHLCRLPGLSTYRGKD
jgi:hypothetical protein